jgi:hypothetical protein
MLDSVAFCGSAWRGFVGGDRLREVHGRDARAMGLLAEV